MRSAASISSLLITLALLHLSHSITVIVDGDVDWKSPTSLHLGDSIVFKHKHLQNLYLFKNRRAFDLCNFAQATLIYKGNSTSISFTWSPSRPGNYYLATKANCKKGEKVPVRVLITPHLTSLSPSPSPSPSAALIFPPQQPAPPPTAGGDFSFSPSHGWGWVASSPSSPVSLPAPPETSPLLPKQGNPLTASSPAGAPESSDGIPFISSNPAVPLPTGMTDTTTIRPLPTPGDANQVVGSSSVRIEVRVLVPVAMCCALGFWM